MTDVEGSVKEARRAVKELGAGGIQIFTNIAGKPLDDPAFEPIFATMAELDRPIWLHPARTAAMPDYAAEQKSRFEMWWCFGWPYETSVAMVRMVFNGLFDRYPEAQDHHPSSRRHDPVLRRPHRTRACRCWAAAPATRTIPRSCRR